MKKLMILGASYSLIPLIKAAKGLGYHTVVTSIQGDYPGFEIADTCCYADISNPDEILEKAKELKIDGITTCCMDIGIRAVGKVRDELGLNGISFDAAQKASNKFYSKEAFLSHGVNCAQSFAVHNRQELDSLLEKMALPLVVKAVDLMGSRGIYLTKSTEEVYRSFEQAMEETKQDYCLVEEYIEGLLFGAEGMIADGKLVYLLPYGTEVYNGGSIATSLGHDVPFEGWETYHEQICDLLLKAAASLGLDNTPFNCDLILKGDKVYLIEINGRAGASCLSESVGIYYGVNYYEMICRQAMGEDVSKWFKLNGRKPIPNLSRILTAPATGELKSIQNKNTMTENLIDLSFNVKCGDEVRRYQNGKDRIGQIIIKGQSPEECRDYLKEVLSKIKIEIAE